MRRPFVLLPLAALLALSPMLYFGTSCGHDLAFHLQSWIDAAAQMRHGTLYPQWTFSAAWQAGEPRFVFYPPLSWMFGALLTLLLPIAAAPHIFLFVVLTAAGVSLYAVARRFASPAASLVAACVYLANPYMFFNAFERSAYAELMAAVWMPLLFLAALDRKPRALLAAMALALAWLTNVPSGIMATYTFALLACLRLALTWYFARTFSEPQSHRLRPPALTLSAGMVLGLALPAFYILPAAVERRFVQASMAIIPNLRYQDNFLFSRTSYEPHNVVTHTVSVLAVEMLVATAISLLALFIAAPPRRDEPLAKRAAIALTALFFAVLFLVLPLSAFVWNIAPELPFLQFPWRLLTVLAVVLALLVALALRRLQRASIAVIAALAYLLIVTPVASHLYRQACDVPHFAQYTQVLFRSGHGVPATDEYTPGDADNDLLRTDSPGFWLAPPAHPDAYAPNTVPNPNEIDANYDGPIPTAITQAQRAPTDLTLHLDKPAVLVLNLRDFPAWAVTVNDAPAPAFIRRDDGLIAFPLQPGASHVRVHWIRRADVFAGDVVSLAALLACALWWRRSRKIST